MKSTANVTQPTMGACIKERPCAAARTASCHHVGSPRLPMLPEEGTPCATTKISGSGHCIRNKICAPMLPWAGILDRIARATFDFTWCSSREHASNTLPPRFFVRSTISQADDREFCRPLHHQLVDVRGQSEFFSSAAFVRLPIKTGAINHARAHRHRVVGIKTSYGSPKASLV